MSDAMAEYGRIPEACRRYGLSRSRLYLLAGAGLIRFVKVGSATLVDFGSVRRYLATRPSAEIQRPGTTTLADAADNISKDLKEDGAGVVASAIGPPGSTWSMRQEHKRAGDVCADPPSKPARRRREGRALQVRRPSGGSA
jgi:hypothetical protein